MLAFLAGILWASARSNPDRPEIPTDADLDALNREQLVAEVKKLRDGIRKHRDTTAHELCWHHSDLWALLPEKSDPVPTVPEWPQFMAGCVRYRQSLDEQAPAAPRTSKPYEGQR